MLILASEGDDDILDRIRNLSPYFQVYCQVIGSTYEQVASGKWDISGGILVFTFFFFFCFIHSSFFLSFLPILPRWMHVLQWRKLWGQSFHNHIWTRMPVLELAETACSRLHSFQVSRPEEEIPYLRLCRSMGFLMWFRHVCLPREVNVFDVSGFRSLHFPTWLQVKQALL